MGWFERTAAATVRCWCNLHPPNCSGEQFHRNQRAHEFRQPWRNFAVFVLSDIHVARDPTRRRVPVIRKEDRLFEYGRLTMLFRNAKMLASMAMMTALGAMSAFTPSASAQVVTAHVHVERVVDLTCVDTVSSYAGTLSINGAAYRISTLRPMLDQIARAFHLEGYNTRSVGAYLRAYSDLDGPEIEWFDGEYNLCIRPRNGYYLLSVERFPTYIVVHENVGYGFINGVCIGSGFAYHHTHVPVYHGPCVTPDGLHIDVHFDFSRYHTHSHVYRHGFRHHDREEWRERREHRDHHHDRGNGHGDDHWRDDDDHRNDNGRGEHGNTRGGNRSGERTGDRARTGGERIIAKPGEKPIDGASRPRVDQPRVEQPGKGSDRAGGERVVRPGQGRGIDDKVSTPAVKQPQPPRERVIVKEPETVKRPSQPPASKPGVRAGDKVQPKPLPIETPAVKPAPRQPGQTPAPAPRQTVKEPSRQPVQAQPVKAPSVKSGGDDSGKSGGNSSGGKDEKRDRRW